MDNVVLETIKSRRSIRKYRVEQISDEMLQTILEAACFAPSGSNNQSWLFTAVQNPNLLEQLNQEVRRGFANLEVAEKDYPAKLRAKKNAQKEDYHFFYHAPTLVIASNVPDYANAMADCSAALQNMFLAAYSLGLGSCWINQLTWLTDAENVRERLASWGIPKEHKICGACAVGFAEGEWPAPPKRKENTTQILR